MKHANRLTEFQKSKLCSILPLGCERSTACDYVGAALDDLQAELALDPVFARAVARAEAEAVLRHMSNIHKAAQDEKNWRTSVWWLEHRARQRVDAGGDAAIDAHLAELVDDLATAIVAEVPDVGVQRRLIARLQRILAGDDGAKEFVIDAPYRLRAPDTEAVASPVPEQTQAP